MNQNLFWGIVGVVMIMTGATIASWGMIAIGLMIFIIMFFDK
jgi:hypothetical protein